MESNQYSSLAELERLLAEEKDKFISAARKAEAARSDEFVEELRVRFVGKKSILQDLLKTLRNLPGEERKAAGARINELKSLLETEFESFHARVVTERENTRLLLEKDDVTLPLPELNVGMRHPIATTMEIIINSLRRLGFSLVDGPEIEHDFYNFEALNHPPDHPAREAQDTFFFNSEWLLRSHTSNVQAHVMLERGVPLRIICPGYVYRCDYDMTHVPCFRQIECLVVDKGVHMGHLRHTLGVFLSEVFGRPVKTRFRSSYFPFTEPSAEMDIECQQCFGAGCRSCKFTGWMELGGCGVVNRNVFKACGVDPDVFSGYAFGFGIDRVTMGRFGIADLRSMYDGDIELFRSLNA